MPRASAEARAASVYQSGGKAPTAPRALSPEGREIWREIVNSKPIGWFDPGSLQLLELYCSSVVDAKALSAQLLVASESEKPRIRKQLIHVTMSCTSLATKCRLSVQSAVDRRSRMLDESVSVEKQEDDALLGGNAVWGGLKVVNG